MQAVAQQKPTVARVATRQAVRCSAQAAPRVEVAKKMAVPAVLVAAFAAVMVSAAPADAASVKATVCASNPTAKICLKDSGK